MRIDIYAIIIVTCCNLLKRNFANFGKNNVVFGDARLVINLITQNTMKTLNTITLV